MLRISSAICTNFCASFSPFEWNFCVPLIFVPRADKINLSEKIYKIENTTPGSQSWLKVVAKYVQLLMQSNNNEKKTQHNTNSEEEILIKYNKRVYEHLIHSTLRMSTLIAILQRKRIKKLAILFGILFFLILVSFSLSNNDMPLCKRYM